MSYWVKIDFYNTSYFSRTFKKLKKKYVSIPDDLKAFKAELLKNPNAGEPLGGKLRKVRVSIKSKNKGKSGGARVATYTIILSKVHREIHLIQIYDKSDLSTIETRELKQLIRELGL